MKTASVIASLSRNAGGLFESVRRLHQSLAEIPNVSVSVLGLRDEFTDADRTAWSPLNVRAFSTRGPQHFGYAPGLKQTLLELDEDIIHTHGIWMYPSVVVRDWHRKTGRPYLVSPHGMLDPWAVKNSTWKKKLALLFYEREHLQNAACLRALCESEAKAMRAFGLKNPICIIPNGIDVPEIGNQKAENKNEFQLSAFPISAFTGGRKVLLYLGRIHPKKGLANLLKAWAAVQRTEDGGRRAEEWVLAIAGWDQGGHEAELKSLASELGLAWMDVREAPPSPPRSGSAPVSGASFGVSPKESVSPFLGPWNAEHIPLGSVSAFQHVSVLFVGPQFNEDKVVCYQNCDAFILPSFSEGLPMVILEAWAHGKPVLMTPECNLPEGFAANAAIRIEPNVESIAQGLEQLLRSPSSDLCSLGANGRALVAARFTWPKLASELKLVYDFMLGGGAKPESVILK
jgi:poly(glycerol-phosphate) alpha-glucosyltransferase